VLFICKTKSRLRQRHCGLACHFKTDPTETVALCFGYAKTLFWRRRHYGLARHFKTDPTKTVVLCFGYAKTLFWRADGKADEQDNSLCRTPFRSKYSGLVSYKDLLHSQAVWDFQTCQLGFRVGNPINPINQSESHNNVLYINCFAFNFLTLAGSNCPFCVLFYLINVWLWSKKGHKKGQFEPARVRKLNEKHFSCHIGCLMEF
jgi:hypothetical protein